MANVLEFNELYKRRVLAERIQLQRWYIGLCLDLIPHTNSERDLVKLFGDIRDKLDGLEDDLLKLNKL